MGVDVGRRQVLAYRIAAQQLDRSGDGTAVLDLGVQDTPYGTARIAMAARTPASFATDGPGLLRAWTTRGAPHLHRGADLPGLAAALWPMSDADATARISVTAIKEGARLGVAAFTATATALREVVTGPLPKGEVSAAVTARVPESLSYGCRVCEARHISGGLFQQAGLFGGVRLAEEPGTVLAPVGDWPGVPATPGDPRPVIRTYLRLLGPASLADVAAFLGTRQSDLKKIWPDDLAEVLVDGRPAWLPADRLEALEAAPEPRLVRLLPPLDPFLQTRNRELLVPDQARRKALWRILAGPGAVLADGEIVGVWRSKLKGRAALEVTITPFGPVSAGLRESLRAEAERLAAVREIPRTLLTIEP